MTAQRASVSHGMLSGLAEIAEVGKDTLRGGYSRHVFQSVERELREWFTARAIRIGLAVETDQNGNLWAWWGEPANNAVVIGSHLDSVPGGGAYDGPLGVVSALDAVEALQANGLCPSRPFAIVVFAEEEGSRFGVACLGSRLLAGAIDVDAARALRDVNDVTFADAAAGAGLAIEHLGRDQAAIARIGLFIELHVEQGRGLIDLGSPVAVASSILAHGRWRLDFSGEGNHAGATRMGDRRDPMVAAASSILAIRDAAIRHGGLRATVGRIEVVPGGTNVIASRVTTWLDARAASDAEALELVAEITQLASDAATSEGCTVQIIEQSFGGRVDFDSALRDQIVGSLAGTVPTLSTGAGHDAGILAAVVPTAMIFVRNPTGISHSPEEFSSLEDCLAGVDALTTVLGGLLGSPREGAK